MPRFQCSSRSLRPLQSPRMAPRVRRELISQMDRSRLSNALLAQCLENPAATPPPSQMQVSDSQPRATSCLPVSFLRAPGRNRPPKLPLGLRALPHPHKSNLLPPHPRDSRRPQPLATNPLSLPPADIPQDPARLFSSLALPVPSLSHE